MFDRVPACIEAPYPGRFLGTYMRLMFRSERVSKQLMAANQEAVGVSELERNAAFGLYWGAVAAMGEAGRAFDSLREMGLLPCVVPGSVAWCVAMQEAAP